jgi:hypothetical protein
VKTHVLVLIALLVIPLFCGASFLREFIVADSALDNGASLDYAKGAADHTRGHPYIPFSERHHSLLLVSGVSLAAAVVYVSYITSARLKGRAI